MKVVLLVVAALVCSVLLTSCGNARPSIGAKPTDQLVTGQVVKLKTGGSWYARPAGKIWTRLLGMEVSLSVPYRYGYQADETGFVVGDRPDGLRQRAGAHFAAGVTGIDLPLKQARLQLERTPGVRVLSVDKAHLFGWDSVPYPRSFGHPAHLYDLVLSRPKVHDIFGIPAQSFAGRTQPSWPVHPHIGAHERRVDVLLIGAGGKTFILRFGDGIENLDWPWHVLMSVNVHTPGS
jgi:hypothetical protein